MVVSEQTTSMVPPSGGQPYPPLGDMISAKTSVHSKVIWHKWQIISTAPINYVHVFCRKPPSGQTEERGSLRRIDFIGDTVQYGSNKTGEVNILIKYK